MCYISFFWLSRIVTVVTNDRSGARNLIIGYYARNQPKNGFQKASCPMDFFIFLPNLMVVWKWSTPKKKISKKWKISLVQLAIKYPFLPGTSKSRVSGTRSVTFYRITFGLVNEDNGTTLVKNSLVTWSSWIYIVCSK